MSKLMTIERRLRNRPHAYLTDDEVSVIFGGSDNSRYARVKRMLDQRKLLHIRRGLYCLTEEIGLFKKPHPFELAQYIDGPSYISLESALSYHQLIPESVYTTTSVTTKRSKEFTTPLGVYSYLHLPPVDFYTHVQLVKIDNYQFLMAKPWKAICDYIYCYKSEWTCLSALQNDMRIDLDQLSILTVEEVMMLKEYYHHRRIDGFLEMVLSEQMIKREATA